MSRLNWILLAVGVVGLVTAICIMRKRKGCSCNGNESSTLSEQELSDGTQILVNENNQVVASRGAYDVNYTMMKEGTGTTLLSGGKSAGCTNDFPYWCEKSGYCTVDKNACDNW